MIVPRKTCVVVLFHIVSKLSVNYIRHVSWNNWVLVEEEKCTWKYLKMLWKMTSNCLEYTGTFNFMIIEAEKLYFKLYWIALDCTGLIFSNVLSGHPVLLIYIICNKSNAI